MELFSGELLENNGLKPDDLPENGKIILKRINANIEQFNEISEQIAALQDGEEDEDLQEEMDDLEEQIEVDDEILQGIIYDLIDDREQATEAESAAQAAEAAQAAQAAEAEKNQKTDKPSGKSALNVMGFK